MTSTDRPPVSSHAGGADVLAIAFGTAAAQWALAYLCRMPPAIVPSPVLLTGIVAVQIAGGFHLGRTSSRGWLGAAVTGLVTAVVNLGVLGSILADDPQKALVGSAGFLGVSIVLTVLGFALGRAGRSDELHRDVNWTGAFAKVAVFATLVLIVAGGLVTSHDAGLAAADWPTTEGAFMFLYPLSKMTGDMYFEHAHRLYGALVGLTTLTFAVHLLIQPRVFPRWVRLLAIVAAVLVIVQGVMGGLRVTLDSAPLRIVHGMTAQVFLGLMTAIAIFVSTTWRTGPPAVSHPKARFDRRLSAMILIAMFIQLGLGATYRHFSAEPDLSGGVRHVLWTHIVFAMIVLTLIVFASFRASAHYADLPPVRRSGRAMSHVLGLQLVLGLLALFAVLSRGDAPAPPTLEVWATTAHQAVGAALLAATVMYAIWLRRFVK